MGKILVGTKEREFSGERKLGQKRMRTGRDCARLRGLQCSTEVRWTEEEEEVPFWR